VVTPLNKHIGYEEASKVAKTALKEGRTRTVGLVIPPAQQRLTEMQLGFVASVVEAAAKVDLDVLVSPSGGDHDRSFERILTARRVDGVILMEIRLEDARVARLQRSGLPFVTIGRTAEPDDTCWIDLDYQALIARCVHHLADLGHRDVALINRSTELVAEATIALRMECTVEELIRTIHAHPTMAEAIGEAAHAAHGSAIHL